MNILYCPITNEKILSVAGNGVMKRENYAEIWFVLSDNSRMRVAISKSAREQLTEADTDTLFATIKTEWIDGINSKELPDELKAKQLERVNNLTYTGIESMGDIIINKE